MLTLLNAIENKSYIIDKIITGSKLKSRLSDLAIYEGAQIFVIRSSFGPIILKVLDSKIAIGRGQARKIYLKEM